MKTYIHMYAVTLAILILGTTAGHSQLTWNRMSGLDGGRCHTFLSCQGRLFAGTDGGVYRYDNPTKTWIADTTLTMTSTISSLAGCNRFTLAVGRSLYKSNDGGLTWETIRERFGEDLIRCVGMFDTIAFAAVQGHGIYRSIDAARTWIPFNDGISQPDRSIIRILSDDEVVFALAQRGTLYRSTNAGQQWIPVSVGDLSMDSPAGLYVGTRAVFYDAGRIYDTGSFPAISRAGVYQSTDHGATWRRADYGLPDISIDAIVETSNGYLCASGGMLFTSEEGIFWTRMDGPLPYDWNVGESGAFPLTLIMHNGTLFAGTRFFVHNSYDGGRTWGRAGRGLVSGAANAIVPYREGVVAATWRGVYRIVDNPNTWITVGTPGEVVVWDFVRNTTRLMVAAGAVNDSLYISEDNGLTWDVLGPAPCRKIVELGSRLVGVGEGRLRGVWISTDNGRTWDTGNTGLPRDPDAFGAPLPVMAITSHAGSLVVGTAGGGIYRSTNGGEAWTDASNGIGHHGNSSEYMHIKDIVSVANRLYAVSEEGIYLSIDNATTWTEVVDAENRPVLQAEALAADHRLLYIATGYGGVDTSANGGITWGALDTGFSAPSNDDRRFLLPYVSRLAVAGGTIYAVANTGVWSYPISLIAAAPADTRAHASGAMVRNGRIVLHLADDITGDISFTLYDMLGRMLLQQHCPRGYTGGALVLEHMPLLPGVYVYTIAAGSRVVTGALTSGR